MFGSPSQQSGAGELLFSGGGGGLTHGRSGSSGDAPQAAGPPGPIGGLGSGTSSFDLSNGFPTLGGGGPGLGGIGAGAIGGGLAGNMRQQQLLQQQQYRMATAGQGSINIAAEDFPALGGGASVQQAQQRNGSNPLANLRGGDDAGIGGLAAIGGPTSNGGSNPVLNGLAGGIASLNFHDASSPSGGSSGVGTTKSSSSGGGPDGAPGTAINSEYGLLGLLGVIRITDADRNALALGQDLSALGLNLEPSANKLLDAFGGPFTDKAATKDFRYNVSVIYCIYFVLIFLWNAKLTALVYVYSLPMKTDTCVLLCNLSTTENWTIVQVEFGQSLLYVLRFAKGFISGPRSARAVPTRMEVPCRVEGVVQARGARRWCRSRRRVAQVHLLRLHHLGSPVVQWQRAADRWRFPVRGRCAGAGESVTVAACHLGFFLIKNGDFFQTLFCPKRSDFT